MYWFQPITLLVLGIIAWEDLRERSIHWWLLPVLAIAMIAPAWYGLSTAELYGQMGFNLAFLGLQLVGTLLLLMIKQGRWVNPVDRSIGTGDLLFFVVLAVGLSRANFVLFYMSALVLCIAAHLLLVRLFPNVQRTVPTAGYMAIYLMVWTAPGLIGISPGLYTGSLAEYLFDHGG